MFNTANRSAGVAVKLSGREKLSASRDFYRLYYPLCVSRRIDTWQILYLSYKDPCDSPTISIHKSENKVH